MPQCSTLLQIAVCPEPAGLKTEQYLSFPSGSTLSPQMRSFQSGKGMEKVEIWFVSLCGWWLVSRTEDKQEFQSKNITEPLCLEGHLSQPYLYSLKLPRDSHAGAQAFKIHYFHSNHYVKVISSRLFCLHALSHGLTQTIQTILTTYLPQTLPNHLALYSSQSLTI